jgi:hypothetical protein
MPRGGKRPGAGAPKGNMNALKHGRNSRQLAEMGKIVRENPKLGQVLDIMRQQQHIEAEREEEAFAEHFTNLVGNADKRKGGTGKPEPGPDGRLRYKGLNWEPPTHVWTTITEAATRHRRRQTRKAANRKTRKSKTTHNNQSPNINPEIQSPIRYKTPID